MPRAVEVGASYEIAAYPLYRAASFCRRWRAGSFVLLRSYHSPRYITMQPPLPADTWTAEVNKMVKAYGASIPDDSTQKIIQYLQSHYTSLERKK